MSTTKHDWVLMTRGIAPYIDDAFIEKHALTHISEVLLFDSNVTVNCCEVTPSFEMEVVDFQWETSGSREAVRDEVDEEISGWEKGVEYMHAAGILQRMKDHPEHFHFYGEKYTECSLEEMLEHYHSNPPHIPL